VVTGAAAGADPRGHNMKQFVNPANGEIPWFEILKSPSSLQCCRYLKKLKDELILSA